MRVVIQRVKKSNVKVDNNLIGKIDKGIIALVGFQDADDQKTMKYILDKIINLRIFEDDNGKMNLSLTDIQGGLLVVPNFTLYGDCRKGRRPGYSSGSKVDNAKYMFDEFQQMIKEQYSDCAFGEFQADMEVEIINDGPVTLLLDSDRIF